MSRSYRKNPVFPICCCRGQKWWRQSYNRAYRRSATLQIQLFLNDLSEVIDYDIGSVYKQSYADIWASPSDGKWRIKMLTKDEFARDAYEICKYARYENYLADYKRQYLSK